MVGFLRLLIPLAQGPLLAHTPSQELIPDRLPSCVSPYISPRSPFPEQRSSSPRRYH